MLKIVLKMNRITLFVCIVCFLGGCAHVKPQIESSFYTDASRKKKLNKYFTALTNLKRFNGVVLAYENGEQILSTAFNIHGKNHTSYITTDSQFDIHSVSKLIAKAVIIQMEGKNLINRQDYLSQYIPDFPNGNKITIQHLMENRSGLPRELGLEGLTKNSLLSEEIIQWAKKEKLEFEPGSDKRYSNVGFEILYYLIGTLNNTTFTEHLKNEFFQKLEMKNSGGHFYSNKTNLLNHAQNHVFDEGEIVAIDNITEEDFRQSMLYSTAEDLHLFLSFCSKEPYRTSLQNEKGLITWSGGAEGIRSFVQYDTKTDISFVILANYDELPFQQIIKDTKAILTGKSFEMPKPVNRKAIKLDLSTLEKYVGTYDIVEANHLLLEFKIKKNQLILFQEGEAIAELLAEDENTFFADPKSKESFRFVSTEEGLELLMDWKGIQLKGTKVK